VSVLALRCVGFPCLLPHKAVPYSTLEKYCLISSGTKKFDIVVNFYVCIWGYKVRNTARIISSCFVLFEEISESCFHIGNDNLLVNS